MHQETWPTPLVSIIVVNWNGERFLTDCLQSLDAQTWPNKEFIIVDNGSTDRSVEMLRQWSSGREKVQVLWLKENTGFTRANNLAFRKAEGEWVALLNNDAVVRPDWLANLLRRGNRSERIGMIGSKILFADPPGVIDKAGHLIYRDGQNRGRGTMEPDRGQYDQDCEILWPDACAALYHRDLIQETGGFDDSFFAYGDDADLGMRARLLGWRAWLAPEAVVYHRHSATAGAYSPLKIMLVERNRILLALKNFPLPILLQNPYWTLRRYGWHLYAALKGTGAAARFAGQHGPWRLAVNLLWSYASVVRLLLPALRQRRIIQRNRRLSSREVADLLRRYEIDVRELALRD
ncbi:MAG: glycosyltransferase family 2 protein [Acidobacteria bacterium]|nr:MAG: glycosyltransferase family 2 protein [Acidobacteriota bacterium]